MEETNSPTLFNHALKQGLILGVINIILTMLLYIADYTLMVDWKISILFFLIYIGYTIYAGIGYRKEIGGFIPFGKAFQHGYLVFIISGLLATIFNLVLYNVIDPELPGKLTEATIEKTVAMMEGFGAPEESIDKTVADTRTRMEGQFSFVGSLIGYAVILGVSAIFALITGAIVKRNQPEMM